MIYTYAPTGADWTRILPELILVGAGMLVLLADLFAPVGRRGWLAPLALLGVLCASVSVIYLFLNGDGQTAFFGMIGADHMSLFADLVILFALAVGVLLSPRVVGAEGFSHTGEYYSLLIFAGLGMTLMASATHLMIVFIGLEILSLALYVLCAMAPGQARSQEAGLKYFLLSSFASAFLLYGIALTFGSARTGDLAGIRAYISAHPFSLASGYGPILMAALGLMAVGFAFKVSAIPFQAWTPDVYVGAPTPVTAFMSVGTKVAAFVALARVFLVALHPLAEQWQPLFWVVAVLTMVGGNILAATQSDVKRMLAYSSVANAGYMLIAIATGTQQALASLLIYLAAYATMNVGAFGVVQALERANGSGTTLSDFAALSRRRPGLAATMAIFLFALAGIPLTSGFIGKFFVFQAAIQGGRTDLAVIGALASVVGMYYYLRVVWAMYFTEPAVAAVEQVANGGAPSIPATRPQAAVGGASSGLGVVAVAERAGVRTRSTVATAETIRALGIGEWLGLALAVVGTLLLGVVPWLYAPAALQAAAALFR